MSSSESKPGEANQDLPPALDALWRALLAVSTRGLERIDHELQKRSSLTLTDFEILRALLWG